jgi:hypothetical protein
MEMNSPIALRQAYLMAAEEVLRIERRLSDLNMEQTALNKRLEIAKNIKSELAHATCHHCLGNGWVRVQYDQDDIKSERCDACEGSGLPKESR